MWEQQAAKLLFSVFILGTVSCASTPRDGPAPGSENLDLVIFHNNDGESQLLHAGSGLENYGGIANFAAKLTALRAELPEGSENLFLSSGDNILPGHLQRVPLRMPPLATECRCSSFKHHSRVFIFMKYLNS